MSKQGCMQPTLTSVFCKIADVDTAGLENAEIADIDDIAEAGLTDVFRKIADDAEIAETPASVVKCTYHFLQRFSERVARKSRRRWHFAEQAYLYGTGLEKVKNCHVRNYCEAREVSYGGKVKLYHGFVYCFRDNVAITVFQLPKCLRNCI